MATGWGKKTWGAESWGDLSDATVLTSSVAISTSIGSSTTQANSDVSLSGIAASYTISGSTAGASVEVSTSSVSLSTAIGTTLTNIGVPVTGSSASSAITSITIDPTYLIGEGWGRSEWGSMVWGDNYSVQLQGIPLSVVTGNEDAFTDFTIELEGLQLSAAITPVGTSATSDIEIAHSFLINQDLGSVSLTGTGFVSLTGISLSASLGEPETGLLTEVPVTGVSLQTSLGDLESITGNADVIPTGIASTYSIGDADAVSIVDPTGITASYVIGNTSVTGNGKVVVNGIGATFATGTPNLINWNEVDVGTGVVWTPVDLAA